MADSQSGGTEPLDAGSPLSAGRLAEVARGLAEQFTLLYDATPVDPRAQMAGNTLTVAFEGGLTVLDERHLEAGRTEELRRFRERFFEATGEQMRSVVSTLTGGQVTFFSSAFDPGSRTTSMLFVLDLLQDDGEEQRRAIRSWSEQVRRNARALRLSHLQTRRTHVALRRELGETRLRRRSEDG